VCTGTPVDRLPEIHTDTPALPFCCFTLTGAFRPAGYPYVLNHLGDHLRRRRLDLGLQQKQLAKLLGCHATSVANWESGARQPGIRELAKVIEFLGYDPRPEAATLGERLARRRTAMGMSQKSAAERISVDPSTLAKWEKGLRRPAHKYLPKVYAFLARLKT
jgi:transcriptional regulator with XRE-family HTH domain